MPIKLLVYNIDIENQEERRPEPILKKRGISEKPKE
jgi:hypothetical protein